MHQLINLDQEPNKVVAKQLILSVWMDYLVQMIKV